MLRIKYFKNCQYNRNIHDMKILNIIKLINGPYNFVNDILNFLRFLISIILFFLNL